MARFYGVLQQRPRIGFAIQMRLPEGRVFVNPSGLHQTAVFFRSADVVREQRMWRKWFGFQFWVELDANEPRVVWDFDDFRQAPVGG